MPPWYASEPKGVFSNERLLTDAEIETLLSWVETGAPAGDRADAPAPRQFVENTSGGWSLGTPDYVFKLDEPYHIDDDVYDLNISFFKTLTEADLPEDVWVRGWSSRPTPAPSATTCAASCAAPPRAGGRSRRSRPRRARRAPANC